MYTGIHDSNINGQPNQEYTIIGHTVIRGTSGSQQEILPSDTLSTSGDGIAGANVSIYNVSVRIGDIPGYTQLLLI